MKIMKKNILFGVVCVALLTATSCSDFLDVQPEGDARDNAYFLNDQQAIDAVDGLYVRGEKRNVSICGRPEND